MTLLKPWATALVAACWCRARTPKTAPSSSPSRNQGPPPGPGRGKSLQTWYAKKQQDPGLFPGTLGGLQTASALQGGITVEMTVLQQCGHPCRRNREFGIYDFPFPVCLATKKPMP